MTVGAECIIQCHASFVTDYTFGELMMLLVTENSKVLETFFVTDENIPYQIPTLTLSTKKYYLKKIQKNNYNLSSHYFFPMSTKYFV